MVNYIKLKLPLTSGRNHTHFQNYQNSNAKHSKEITIYKKILKAQKNVMKNLKPNLFVIYMHV